MESFMKIVDPSSDTLIISFAGYDLQYGGIPKFDFTNILRTNFPDTNLFFYTDIYSNLYHNGIYGLSTNIEETVLYLQTEIKSYKNVITLGVSSGGYAAILFGSLLNVQKVIAFIPQTIRLQKDNVDEKYRDITTFINDTTKYYIYGDETAPLNEQINWHHISHCERIANKSNVSLIKEKRVNLREMKNNGKLITILNTIIR
jgi:hypothetical protein